MDLRRGVSASYYALYHELTRHAAEHLLAGGTSDEQAALRRSFGHGAVRVVSQWVAQKLPGAQHLRTVVAAAAGNPHLVAVAEAVLDLQQRRHDADYDHQAAFSKADVLAAVARAETACDLLEGARGTGSYQALMALLALATRELR